MASDIRDIQVAGNVAYEWGYFEAAEKSSDQQAPEKPPCQVASCQEAATRWVLEVHSRDVATRLNGSLTCRVGCTIRANGPRAFDS